MTDLVDPATFQQGFPHERFTEYRDTTPVFRHPHPLWDQGFWNVVRHADVAAVSRNSEVWSSQPTPFLETTADDSGGASMLMISLDPPDHTKMRMLVNRGFTPRRVRDLEAKIRATVDRLMDQVALRTECDLVTDIAVELPLQVIADLVGIPEEDRHQIFEWTEQSFGFDPAIPAETRSEAIFKMYAYADQLCEQRRADPQDDLLSVLIDAEVDGESLTQMQIDTFFLLLQNAGSETTRNLLTTGTKVLLEHPDQLELLRNDLSLLPNATEELLRFVSPVMQFVRRPRVDTEIAGQPIAAGDPVVLWYPSANRDAAVFEDPHRLDITRDASQQVAFGAGGPHFCLGASLARLEANIMFEAIVTRMADLELATDAETLPHVWSNLIDGYASMPVRYREILPPEAVA